MKIINSNKKNSTPFPKNKSLIIGDSISRDIEPQDSTQLEVKSISGATMLMVKTTLESLETDNKKFDNIYLIVGSNDCANAQKTSQSITASAKELFDQSKKLSPNVVFSSIIPCTDDPNAHLKSDSVNQSIKRLCSQFNIKLVDNNGSFLTADRSTNDALLLDGLHLNDKGTQKLISNLGVRAAPRKRGTVRQNPSNQNNIQTVRRNVPSLMSTNKPYSQNNSFRQTEFNRPQRFPSQHQTWNSSIPKYYPTTNNQWNPPATQWNQQPSFNPRDSALPVINLDILHKTAFWVITTIIVILFNISECSSHYAKSICDVNFYCEDTTCLCDYPPLLPDYAFDIFSFKQPSNDSDIGNVPDIDDSGNVPDIDV